MSEINGAAQQINVRIDVRLIMVLKAGKLIEKGTQEELLEQKGEYAYLWHIQAQAYQI